MAARALCRSGFKIFVAVDALEMKRIRAFGYFFVTLGRVVAFTAGLRIRILIFRQRMVAVAAGKAVAFNDSVNFMIKQDVTRCDIKHQTQGLMRCL